MAAMLVCLGIPLLMWAGGEVPTQPVKINLEWKGAALSEKLTVQVMATPAEAQSKATPDEVVRDCLVPGAVDLRLPEGLWWVTLKGPQIWAEPRQAHVAQNSKAVDVEIWPAGLVKGRVKIGPGETMPDDLLIRFAPPPKSLDEKVKEILSESPQRSAEPEGVQRCPISKGAFECLLPAQRLDLRMRSEPFITHYRWGVMVGPGETTNLGTLVLERGASLVGWVVTHDGSPLTKEARVDLQPAGLATPVSDEQNSRNRMTVITAPINDRGFFHVAGLKPGEYQLTALQSPFGPATATVRVISDREAELRSPLVLAPPEKLSVLVEPAVDPDGQPWRIRLLRTDYYRSRAEQIVDEPVPADGWWERDGLAARSYRLSLIRPSGDQWVSRDVELGEELMPIRLEVSAIRVEGKVLLGDEPLAATLWFGSRFGAVRSEFRSDEEGYYTGLLPHPGEWVIEMEAWEPSVHRTIRGVEVERDEEDKPAQVDIVIPPTIVRVEVLTDKGRPQPHAVVYADPVGDHVMTGVWRRADALGECEFYGLGTGLHYLHASGPDSHSENVIVMVSEDLELSPVTLTLRKRMTVRGRVISSVGAIPGAKLIMSSVEPDHAPVKPVITDANGNFEYPLPPDTRQVRFSLLPPGFAYRTGYLDIPEDGFLEIEVSQFGGAIEVGAPEYSLWGDYHPSLFHNGVATHWVQLVQMAISRESREGFDFLVVPSMEAGTYFLCWRPTTPRPEPQIESSEHCREGQLLPMGRLTLSIPAYPSAEGDNSEAEVSGQ